MVSRRGIIGAAIGGAAAIGAREVARRAAVNPSSAEASDIAQGRRMQVPGTRGRVSRPGPGPMTGEGSRSRQIGPGENSSLKNSFAKLQRGLATWEIAKKEARNKRKKEESDEEFSRSNAKRYIWSKSENSFVELSKAEMKGKPPINRGATKHRFDTAAENPFDLTLHDDGTTTSDSIGYDENGENDEPSRSSRRKSFTFQKTSRRPYGRVGEDALVQKRDVSGNAHLARQDELRPGQLIMKTPGDDSGWDDLVREESHLAQRRAHRARKSFAQQEGLTKSTKIRDQIPAEDKEFWENISDNDLADHVGPGGTKMARDFANGKDLVQIHKSEANHEMIAEMMAKDFGLSPQRTFDNITSAQQSSANLHAIDYGNNFELHQNTQGQYVIAPIGYGSVGEFAVPVPTDYTEVFETEIAKSKIRANYAQKAEMRKSFVENDSLHFYRKEIDALLAKTYRLAKSTGDMWGGGARDDARAKAKEFQRRQGMPEGFRGYQSRAESGEMDEDHPEGRDYADNFGADTDQDSRGVSMHRQGGEARAMGKDRERAIDEMDDRGFRHRSQYRKQRRDSASRRSGLNPYEKDRSAGSYKTASLRDVFEGNVLEKSFGEQWLSKNINETEKRKPATGFMDPRRNWKQKRDDAIDELRDRQHDDPDHQREEFADDFSSGDSGWDRFSGNKKKKNKAWGGATATRPKMYPSQNDPETQPKGSGGGNGGRRPPAVGAAAAGGFDKDKLRRVRDKWQGSNPMDRSW